MQSDFGKLYIVATPIGNLGDLSPRAKEVLLVSDIIVAEDTRSLRSLLPDENISATVLRGDAVTENRTAEKVLANLREGRNIAVITDAGTPAISDPGYILVKTVRQEIPEVEIIAVPGPSALTAALSISGLPATPFTFFGFPPIKKGRSGFFQMIGNLDHTSIIYESPHRFMKTLNELKAVLPPERRIFVGRELTKIHEEGQYGSLADIITYYRENEGNMRGEFVIVISGK